MRAMPMGPGVDRWGRLLLIALLVLLLPGAIGIDADDGWIATSDPADPADADDDRLHLAAGARSDPAWLLPAPVSVGRMARPDDRDPVVAGRTCLPPPDRAPPRD
jgi:hypothetical protein